MNAPAPSIAPDLIVGAAALARFIHGSDAERFQRRVYYLAMAGCKRPLPHFRLGSQVAARRSTILAWIERQEASRHARLGRAGPWMTRTPCSITCWRGATAGTDAATHKPPRVAAAIASAKTVAAIERLARADHRHAATSEEWDTDPWLLNTPGGTVDLRTGRCARTSAPS